MDIELIKALTDLPVVAILIYLLIRLQGQNEKLLAELVESERQHARNLVDIMCNRDIPLTGKLGLHPYVSGNNAEVPNSKN